MSNIPDFSIAAAPKNQQLSCLAISEKAASTDRIISNTINDLQRFCAQIMVAPSLHSWSALEIALAAVSAVLLLAVLLLIQLWHRQRRSKRHNIPTASPANESIRHISRQKPGEADYTDPPSKPLPRYLERMEAHRRAFLKFAPANRYPSAEFEFFASKIESLEAKNEPPTYQAALADNVDTTLEQTRHPAPQLEVRPPAGKMRPSLRQ